MGSVLSVLLDLMMMSLLVTAIAYAIKLHRQLAALRASRGEMEKFVAEFSATVQRAEASVRGLKQAAREGGDDLERQIEKAHGIRDELAFLVDSADKIATRLSDRAATATRATAPEAAKTAPKAPPTSPPQTDVRKATPATASAAERDLLKALEKLG